MKYKSNYRVLSFCNFTGSPLRTDHHKKWGIDISEEWNEFQLLSNEGDDPVVLIQPANHSHELPPAYTPEQIEEQTMRQFQMLKVH